MYINGFKVCLVLVVGISPNEVSDGFVALMADAPYGVEKFTDYILETFIDDDSSFPPYLWVESPSSNLRITNRPESFHRDFNSQFYISIPIVLL